MDLPLCTYNDPPSIATKLLNGYIEAGPPQATGPTLRGFPGISSYKEIGDGPIRAVFIQYGVKYVVSGDEFYKVVLDNVSKIGDLTGTKRPKIKGNVGQIAVLVEPNLWVYTIATDTFAQVTDTDFEGATSIDFFDQYITYTKVGSGQWGASDFSDATSFDSLFFATAEGSPDNLVGHIVDHRQALLLGVESCELWDNAGVDGFPFIRAANGFIEIGCLAGDSACKVDQSIIWLASDKTVRRLEGVTPVRISTHAVERAIAGYTTADAYAQSFTWQGHIFYVLTFPEATLAYDVTTQQWLELQSDLLPNWRGLCSAQGDRIYVGDSESNKLGVLADVYDEFGDLLVMEGRFSPVFSHDFIRHSMLEIYAEMGVGLSTGQGSDPEIMLIVSDDGGMTFRELTTRKLGQMGEYKNRARWSRLGRSKNRVYGFRISDPVARKIFFARLTAG